MYWAHFQLKSSSLGYEGHVWTKINLNSKKLSVASHTDHTASNIILTRVLKMGIDIGSALEKLRDNVHLTTL